VGVDHTKGGRLAAQMHKDVRQHGMLMHIGKIAGMERVPIIHRSKRGGINAARPRRSNPRGTR
jgi:hypothetical protein